MLSSARSHCSNVHRAPTAIPCRRGGMTVYVGGGLATPTYPALSVDSRGPGSTQRLLVSAYEEGQDPRCRQGKCALPLVDLEIEIKSRIEAACHQKAPQRDEVCPRPSHGHPGLLPEAARQQPTSKKPKGSRTFLPRAAFQIYKTWRALGQIRARVLGLRCLPRAIQEI